MSISPGTLAARLYGTAEAIEDYYCNYGVNAEYERALEDGGLRVSGRGDDGEARIVELPAHPFFLATLFLPQTRSTAERPHPVIAGFAAAVTARARTLTAHPARTHR